MTIPSINSQSLWTPTPLVSPSTNRFIRLLSAALGTQSIILGIKGLTEQICNLKYGNKTTRTLKCPCRAQNLEVPPLGTTAKTLSTREHIVFNDNVFFPIGKYEMFPVGTEISSRDPSKRSLLTSAAKISFDLGRIAIGVAAWKLART